MPEIDTVYRSGSITMSRRINLPPISMATEPGICSQVGGDAEICATRIHPGGVRWAEDRHERDHLTQEANDAWPNDYAPSSKGREPLTPCLTPCSRTAPQGHHSASARVRNRRNRDARRARPPRPGRFRPRWPIGELAATGVQGALTAD